MDYIRSMLKIKSQNKPNSSLPLKPASGRNSACSLPFDILEEIFLFVPYKYCQNIWIASSILQIPLAQKLKRLHEYQEWLQVENATLKEENEKLKISDETRKKEADVLKASYKVCQEENSTLKDENEKLKISNETRKKEADVLKASYKVCQEENATLKDENEKLKTTEEVEQEEMAEEHGNKEMAKEK
ncbi:hypothetical protein Ddc_09270 [Ditylenchus destructor]|nr:hypothetical protein Ddc_09270 [Ditylenchus destructor]